MRKIQFRYDDSDEAKKALEWIEQEHGNSYVGDALYYNSDGVCGVIKPFPDYTLLTPSEFLREVTGENEWLPKVGEIVGFLECGGYHKGEIIAIQKNEAWIKTEEYNHVIELSKIKPIPTLKQKVVEVLQTLRKDQISEHVYSVEPYADRIIQFVKGCSDE